MLEEALDRTVPLLERLKFLSIVSSNLDEFFMVRVAGIKRQIDAEVVEPTADGMTPRQQDRAISERVHRMVAEQYGAFTQRRAPRAQGRRRRLRRAPRARRRTAPVSPALLQRRSVPGADADGRGPGAPVPGAPQREPLHRRAPQARGREEPSRRDARFRAGARGAEPRSSRCRRADGACTYVFLEDVIREHLAIGIRRVRDTLGAPACG